jgi:hypothetical protein
MPSKKPNNTTVQFAQKNSERRAIISVGDSAAAEPEKTGKDDAGKTLYLKRI